MGGLAFLAIAVYGIYLSLNAASRPATLTARRPNEGIVSGFLLTVTSFQRDAADPSLTVPGSNRIVKVQLSFENASGSQQRADPRDFRLRAEGGADHEPTFASSGDCRRWQIVDLYPPKGDGGPLRDSDATRSGPTFGPVTLCFATTSGEGSLSLVWSPDVGLTGGTVIIPLRSR